MPFAASSFTKTVSISRNRRALPCCRVYGCAHHFDGYYNREPEVGTSGHPRGRNSYWYYLFVLPDDASFPRDEEEPRWGIPRKRFFIRQRIGLGRSTPKPLVRLQSEYCTPGRNTTTWVSNLPSRASWELLPGILLSPISQGMHHHLLEADLATDKVPTMQKIIFIVLIFSTSKLL